MFKRANKVTSLLVAAAAVMSLVPAYASDVKKIDSEDGVVYDAVAYKDGKDLIDGEVSDNDAAYYYAGGKYTELEDVDSGSDYEAYGDKYVAVGSNDYFVNLEDGTVTDDNKHDDDIDDAAAALRKKAKDVDRYNNNTTVPALTILPGLKYGDTWYKTTAYEAVDGKLGNGLTDGEAYNVYTDKDGNYIDADFNLGKIKVATTDKSATIENTSDSEDLNFAEQTYAHVTYAKELGQDKDNIYRYAEIKVYVKQAATTGAVKINNKKIEYTDVHNNVGEILLPVIQKISKAQASDDKDDAKYAKTVTNYVIAKDDQSEMVDPRAFTANATGNPDDNDRDKFLDLLLKTDAKAAMVNGKLAVYYVNNDSDNTDDSVYVQAASLKQKNGWYYTDVESKTSLKAEYNDKLDKAAADTDVDGNIYAIDGGYIKEFDGTDDWNKIYKVDGSMNDLSVYDKDNMVAWSQEDEVYSIIGGTTADTTTGAAVTAGWSQNTDGTWSYINADGTKKTGWFKDTNGVWYFLKADGIMATGWYKDVDGTWYFLASSGAMQTGWINDGGTWYYCNASGAMLYNTTVDGYVLGASGAWIK